VVHSGDATVGTADFTAGETEAFKGLGRRDLVEQLKIDVENRRLALRLDDYVLLPDLFEKRFWIRTH
jgi:hypothetical protein